MRVYLDHNATTPLRDEVTEAMLRVLREDFGNPSSTHAEGARAREHVDRARARAAALVGMRPGEILFTAGATEANNLALASALARAGERAHLVTSTIEHPSVAEPAAHWEARGVRVTRVPVDSDGLLDPEAVVAALDEETSLVSIILANNETGVIQPVAAFAGAVRARGILVHVDATQALGKIPVDADALGVDLVSASAHKLNGPKGVGFLGVRSGVPLEPLLRGGPQERRLRGGTENVAGIAGLGMACELAKQELPERSARYARLRDRLWQGLRSKVPDVRRNGPDDPTQVLPNTLNVEFERAPGEILSEALDLEGVAVSMGAACHSGSVTPSAVLSAMGRTAAQARGSLRFSVGHGVDEAGIDAVLAILPGLVARARATEEA